MQERVCVCKKLKIGIRASSTLAWYKYGGVKNDKVMYNFEHGAELMFRYRPLLPSNLCSFTRKCLVIDVRVSKSM